MSTTSHRRWERARRVGVFLAASLIAAGCGSGDDSAADETDAPAATSAPAATTAPVDTSAPSSAPADNSKFDDSAVLRIGENFGSTAAKPVFDPIASSTAASAHYLFYVYDSLLRQDRDGNYSPALATSAEIVDQSTITVTLLPNLTFQDGTPLDAAAVKFTIERNKQANNQGGMRQGQLQAVESIDVASPTELTIHLSKPIAGAFYDLLAHNETVPVSPTAVQSGTDLTVNPVGAGPFKLVSQTDQEIRLERWDGYHDVDKVHLAAIDVINVASPEAMVNAYRTGEIDFDTWLSYTDLQQLDGAPIESDTRVGPLAGANYVSLQCAKNPSVLGDVRVRQALIYATDREAINQVIYEGEGEVQTQLLASANPAYDADLDALYGHDVDKAKSLLAEAGVSQLTVSMVQSAGALGRIAEMLQQQWSEAGITVNLVATNDPVTDFYKDGKIQTIIGAAAAKWWSDRITRYFTSDSIGGTCLPTDPLFVEKVATLQGLDPSSAEAATLYQELTRTILEEADFVPLTMAPTVLAWSNRFSEMAFRPNSGGYLGVDFLGTGVVSD